MNDVAELELPPDSAAINFEAKLRQLLHEWFVTYNPLYFASALSFLLGVFLGSEELTPLDWRLGDLALAGIVQLYELALIAAAVVLWRSQLKRPATILLLLEALFFFDPTGEIETLIHLEPWDLPLAAFWLLLAAGKIWVLARAFGLRLNSWSWTVIFGSAAALVAPPLLLDAFPHAAERLHPLALLVMLGLAALAFSRRCQIQLRDGGEPSREIAGCLNGILGLALTLSLFHLISWLYVFDLELNLLHLAAILVIWVGSTRSEGAVWLGSGVLLAAMLPRPEDWCYLAGGLALLLAWRAWREARPSLYGAALLCLDLAVRTFGWENGYFPAHLHWIDALVLAALVWLAWRYRVFFGLAVALTPTLPRLLVAGSHFDQAEKAITLIVAAFLLLFAGLVINLKVRGSGLKDERVPSPDP